jgi:hypothetical protein
MCDDLKKLIHDKTKLFFENKKLKEDLRVLRVQLEQLRLISSANYNSASVLNSALVVYSNTVAETLGINASEVYQSLILGGVEYLKILEDESKLDDQRQILDRIFQNSPDSSENTDR